MKTASYSQKRSPTWRDLPIDLISRSQIARWAPIPLRLIVGYGFMEHGFAKLARGLDAFPAILQALGVPAPHFMGLLTILVEIVGGLAVLLGALVPLASILTVSARSSSRLSRLPARSSGLRALKPISSTSHALRPLSWPVRDRCPSRVFWQSTGKYGVRRGRFKSNSPQSTVWIRALSRMSYGSWRSTNPPHRLHAS